MTQMMGQVYLDFETLSSIDLVRTVQSILHCFRPHLAA